MVLRGDVDRARELGKRRKENMAIDNRCISELKEIQVLVENKQRKKAQERLAWVLESKNVRSVKDFPPELRSLVPEVMQPRKKGYNIGTVKFEAT
jgi:hypothetical protein